ncbi:MAG: GYF domain-containing protein [Planctomycetaceae bacterium]
MGIVAVCPNGHRIKVKEELAGRKGICPSCSARFRIPRKADAPATFPGAGDLERPPTARIVSLDPSEAAALPQAFLLEDADTADAFESSVESTDAGPDFAPVDVRADLDEPRGDGPSAGSAWQRDGAAFADAQGPVHAALEDQPGLAWCVAIRGGAPSAPLDAAAMRTWLASGAASADHVVWRQDWPEWRPLEEVFPDALPPPPPGWP